MCIVELTTCLRLGHTALSAYATATQIGGGDLWGGSKNCLPDREVLGWGRSTQNFGESPEIGALSKNSSKIKCKKLKRDFHCGGNNYWLLSFWVI